MEQFATGGFGFPHNVSFKFIAMLIDVSKFIVNTLLWEWIRFFCILNYDVGIEEEVLVIG